LWAQAHDHDHDHDQGPGAGQRFYQLGSPAWVAAGSAEASTKASTKANTEDEGLSVCLGSEQGLWARFVFAEALKSDALETVQALQAQGLQVHVLSGDRQVAVQRVAQALGLSASQTHAAQQPQDKLRVMSEWQQMGRLVAMVGDGLNDGPVLARAHVSMALGQAAPLAQARADLVLLSGRVEDVRLTHQLAQKTMRVVRQNLLWAAVYNAVCVPLALAGWLPPWAAGIGMAGSSLAVIANAWRLQRGD
jgi:Cu2+-exporting ATPase